MYPRTLRRSRSALTRARASRVQDGKDYIIPYVVYEKVWDCGSYPPDGVVTFRNIYVECDYKVSAPRRSHSASKERRLAQDCTNKVQWSAQVSGAPGPAPCAHTG